MAALRQLKAEGTLAEAYSPGGPGAVLIFDAGKEAVEGVVSVFPLVLAKLIDTEPSGTPTAPPASRRR